MVSGNGGCYDGLMGGQGLRREPCVGVGHGGKAVESHRGQTERSEGGGGGQAPTISRRGDLGRLGPGS